MLAVPFDWSDVTVFRIGVIRFASAGRSVGRMTRQYKLAATKLRPAPRPAVTQPAKPPSYIRHRCLHTSRSLSLEAEHWVFPSSARSQPRTPRLSSLRAPTPHRKTVPAGVTVAQVDFTNAAAVAAVLQKHEVDVVLATLTTTAAAAQKPLVDAAKVANVKLFVPAEYGIPTEGYTEGPPGDKNKIAEYLKSVGIPSLRIFNGLFTEFVPWLVLVDGKIKLVGKGEAPVSFTSIADIAGFVAHVLTTLPPAELNDRIFRLQGERASLASLAPLFNTTVEHVAVIEGEMGEFKMLLQKAMDTGAGSTGWDGVRNVDGTGASAAGSANALWPGHQWKSIKEVHGL
ncbi:hypothetical protein C8R43DRAFT_559122 [Mycena crocata]|nr:hypothetical protein C8R43DRAFT_559122 [Mycena crocata]